MSNDLPQIGFDHAFHSDVIMTLEYSNNLRQHLNVYTTVVRSPNDQC